MKKSLRNYGLFFHRMGLVFFLLPVIVLVISIILPDTGFSEKRGLDVAFFLNSNI